MPPRMSREEFVDEAIRYMGGVAPDLDFRPGSIVRTIIESAADGQGHAHVLTPVQNELDIISFSVVDHPVDPRTLFRLPPSGPIPSELIQETIFPVRTELTVLHADPPDRPTLGWTTHEEVGIAAVNPAAILPTPRRVAFPLFEIASNPTIQLSEIQQRRFNLIDRNSLASPDSPIILALIRHLRGCPCGCGAASSNHCWRQSDWEDEGPVQPLQRRSSWELIGSGWI